MADAPKGDSSSSWGAFEIGFVVLIAAAILFRVDTPSDTSPQAPREEKIVETTEDYSCGLQITSPARNAVVPSTFTLRGITEGCYWAPEGDTVLSYQVIDAQGSPVTDFITIMRTGDAFPYVFEETVTLSTTPTSTSGFIIFVAPRPTTDTQTVSIRIPIRFEKK